MNKKQTAILLYLIWSVIVFLIVFANNGFNLDNVTRVLVIAVLLLQWLVYKKIKKIVKNFSPKVVFLSLGLAFAALVEGCYMISDPVFDSLKLTAGMSMSQMASFFMIDLAITLPVYVVVFLVIWHFINKYQYKTWEYLIFISLGQALGDGFVFFAAAPAMLAFLPYVMINYHAMNLTPYLLIKDKINPPINSWKKYIIPPIAIFAVYVVAAIIIQFYK